MSFLRNGFHPSFEALSALADRSDVDAARLRIGRHVARCQPCAATIAQIRAMGDAARGIELATVPPGLWTAIERARERELHAPAPARETPAPGAAPWDIGPARRPTSHAVSPFRIGGRTGWMALAAAAAIVAVLLAPTSRGDRLEAGAARGSWRFVPRHPAPGATVQVRYEPPPGPAGDSLALLLGTPIRRGDDFVHWTALDGGLQDSLATLVRGRDGAYTGRFSVPADFGAMSLRLTDLHNTPVRRFTSADGPVSSVPEPLALLVAGDAGGRPMLRALAAAASARFGGSSAAYALADTLVRYYPDEPIGYALLRKDNSRRLLDELVAWFRRGERQYLRFDQRFTAAPSVSADHMLDMIVFAHRIDEPAEVRKWTLRLAADHPQDPRTLDVFGSMLHGMLNRAGTVDTIRRDLPMAEALWSRNGRRGSASSIASLARTVGDTAAYRRWSLRAVTAQEREFRGGFPGVNGDMIADEPTRVALVPVLRREAGRECRVPSGKVPEWNNWMTWRERCENGRASAFIALSTVERRYGDPRRALALADSAVTINDVLGRCWEGSARRERGAALLAMGDTMAALPELAAGLDRGNWQSHALRDSTERALRPAVSASAWRDAVRRQSEARARCLAAAGQRQRELRAFQRAPAIR